MRLTDNDADDVAPAWSPDGTRLAFASDRDGDYDLYVIDLACLEDGCTEDNATPLTDNDADDSIPAWMPDGEHLVFQSDRDGDGWNLYLLNLADGTVTRLTETAGDEVSAAVQPGSALSLGAGVPGARQPRLGTGSPTAGLRATPSISRATAF
ncbi:MAG: DPP IV N-terminal domain-containing protein [Anaerolineae bacterium]|nr:DPP IV N-terminal domain-containing protein [Anaerolineae bacterium]